MSDFSKIAYYDLKLEAMNGRLPSLVGRGDDMLRISRVVGRNIHNNCVLVGASGVGKTALLRGWAHSAMNVFGTVPIVELSADSFASLTSTSTIPLQKFKEAFATLPVSIVCIDGLGALFYNKPSQFAFVIQLLKPLVENQKIKLVMVLESKEFAWMKQEQPNFFNYFEVITVKSQDKSEQCEIVNLKLASLGRDLEVSEEIVTSIIDFAYRFQSLGELPASAVSVLDETISLARSRGSNTVTEDDVCVVVADRVGIPLSQLKISEKEKLKNLEHDLNERVIGQASSLKRIASTITRAKLGLKNPSRPLGSFLVLGPSGVGKTETAKFLAEQVFGKKESFMRIDMSEFGEAHSVSRLIGAPAGYVGFDAGGGLTNGVKAEPYSLVLLDEIEKAHPKIFDIFLQLLDDGRLTSGQGETVDFTQTIVMATSNLAAKEILEGYTQGLDIHSEQFVQDVLMPVLSKNLRLEFLNRFDAVLVFKPLNVDDLLDVAMLEIQKIEARVAKHNIRFDIKREVLRKKVETLSDPRFGARPVKRFIETVCEDLITKKLLQ